jgi:hypothetical protein
VFFQFITVLAYGPVADKYVAFAYAQVAGNHFHGGAFAGTVWSEKAYYLARANVKRDVVNRFLKPKTSG